MQHVLGPVNDTSSRHTRQLLPWMAIRHEGRCSLQYGPAVFCLSVNATYQHTPSTPSLHTLQACLTENPKSYSAWHHRKWVVLQEHADLQKEMKLVNR